METRGHVRSLTPTEKSLLASIIAEHGPHVQRFLESRALDPADREDIAQETYLRLIRYENVATLENPRAFLFRIADNLIKDRGRRAAFRKEHEHLSVDDIPLADPAPTQEHILQGDQSLARFKQALKTMHPKQRQAFLLSRADELNYHDIAKLMAVSVKSVEKYISGALAHIRKALGGVGAHASLEKGPRKMTDANTENATVRKQADEDRLLTEAETWFARLSSPEVSGASKAAFAAWRLKDARHAEAYQEVCVLWEQSAGKLDQLRGDAEIAALLQQARQPAGTHWWRRPLPVAACVAAVLVVAVAIHSLVSPVVSPAVYLTPVGERRTVTLADGSQIVMDAATVVEVALTEANRRLALVKGQARFIVAPVPERPFEVKTATGSVTVLGTVFDVRAQADGATVTLIEGAVAVRNSLGGAEKHRVLQPNQRVALLRNGDISPPVTVDPALAGEWTQGRLVFRDEPLPRVVEELNRYSTRTIVLGYGLESYRLRGTFNADDPKAVIRAISELFPVRVVEESQSVVLLKTKKN